MSAYRLHKCTAGCGKWITWQFAICSDCEKIYGRSALNDWPEWLRDAWNAEQRRRRAEYRHARHEISFTDLELSMTNGESPE